MTDLKGLTPAKLSSLSAGQTVQVRGLGPCLADGAHTVCRAEDGGLFLPCGEGRHCLHGQTLDDGDTLAGIYTGEPVTEPRVEADLAAWLDAAGDPGGAPPETVDAAEAVLIERKRQIEVEGYDPASDDRNYSDVHARNLALAAAAYAASASSRYKAEAFMLWPFHPDTFKPRSPREDLVRAGALILAEIERLDRQAAREGE